VQLLGDLLLIDDLPVKASIISMTSIIAFPFGQVDSSTAIQAVDDD
jgi:hypothetical protein